MKFDVCFAETHAIPRHPTDQDYVEAVETLLKAKKAKGTKFLRIKVNSIFAATKFTKSYFWEIFFLILSLAWLTL